jgi:tetratricopeptide (TPR) repeat protein
MFYKSTLKSALRTGYYTLVLTVIVNGAAVLCDEILHLPDETPRPANNTELKHNTDPVHPPIQTAAFQNVSPGTTTLEQITSLWGEPLQETNGSEETVRLYSTDSLRHVEVTFKENIVKSIVVQLATPFPEEQVRSVLASELLKSRPVLIPDEKGEIIGEVFPEKGVIFLFASQGKRKALFVRQIGIEPVSAEPFVLRAEALLPEQPAEARRDILDALKLNPDDAKAYSLLAQIETMQGHLESAMLHCEKAIQLDEQKPAYHIALAQAMIRMNRIEEAKLYLEESLRICEGYPHEKSRVLCILGDLYRTSAKPDYELAYECHSDAIRIAMALLEHTNPTIRLTAKDVLFDAHLATARDIAWGKWDKKNEAIAKWLNRAKVLMQDPELQVAKRFSNEYPFKAASCALAVLVCIPEQHNIDLYIEDVIDAGNALINGTNDQILIHKWQWETSLSLYDAMQIFQLRKQYQSALKYGELAAKYMEMGIVDRTCETDQYLLGRLYFRLGAVHAIGNQNHRAAIEWFDSAKEIFERLLPKIDPEALGKLGETMVSMGVSYWATDQRDEAVRLTERGLRQIERAVRADIMSPAALTIPYSNLSKMYQELGDSEHAAKYNKLAAAAEKNSAIR